MNTTPRLQRAFDFIIFPVYFLVMIPVEYDLWKAYKKDKNILENLIQFIWKRMR